MRRLKAAFARLRFGIGMNTDHTLEEVGQQFSAQSKPLDDPDGGSAQVSSHNFKFACGDLQQSCEP
jgi:hypothetical protein